MYTFPELLKKIREESRLTQSELAQILDVSEVLITMMETGKKEVSKNFIVRLAVKLRVKPNSITPFIFEIEHPHRLTGFEKQLVQLGEKLQIDLIKNKSRNLKKNV